MNNLRVDKQSTVLTAILLKETNSFPLLSTINLPRPCASYSSLAQPINYYLSQYQALNPLVGVTTTNFAKATSFLVSENGQLVPDFA